MRQLIKNNGIKFYNNIFSNILKVICLIVSLSWYQTKAQQVVFQCTLDTNLCGALIIKNSKQNQAAFQSKQSEVIDSTLITDYVTNFS